MIKSLKSSAPTDQRLPMKRQLAVDTCKYKNGISLHWASGPKFLNKLGKEKREEKRLRGYN